MIRIVIDDIPPSNNKYLGNSNSHWKYTEEKKRWRWIVKAAVKERPKKPYIRAIVKIIYFFKDNHRRDPDNYSGKFILDALKAENIISDDNFDAITLIVQKGGIDKNNPRTVVEITEVS